MSLERWDVALRFVDGPLAWQSDQVLRGPVIRIGANPGPGGLRLDGYRGLDDRHAVITAYDGSTVSIAPVGPNQVRTAEHQHVDWNAIQPIRGPVYLTEGTAIHLGPPGRGATALYVGCRRLGEWQQRVILSDAGDVADQAPAAVKKVDARTRFPWWLIPGFMVIFTMFVSAAGILVFLVLQRDVARLGPIREGSDDRDFVDTYSASFDAAKDQDLYRGVEQMFHVFVMQPNAAAADRPSLADERANWDKTLLEWTTRAEKDFGEQRAVWRMFERARGDYARVLAALQENGYPAALAAIPFQESGYRATPQSPACGKGWWQFMPETAKRVGLVVDQCKLTGRPSLWSPSLLAPPANAYKNADYIEDNQCLVVSCAVDERVDLDASTAGAVMLFGEAWKDPELRASGSLVQATIAAHNAGHDDRDRRDGFVSTTQIGPGYRKWRKASPTEPTTQWFGRNFTCRTREDYEQAGPNATCGGTLARETQLYVPRVLAYHALAVCYYGRNYGDEPIFRQYATFDRDDRYCTQIDVPTASSLREAQR